MAQKKPKISMDEPKKVHGKKAVRGTQDEFQIIGMILAENPILRQRVLEKIKLAQVTARATASISGKIENSVKTEPTTTKRMSS